MKTILLVAYAVSPTKGSEYSVAWNYIKHMSRYYNLIILYGKSSQLMGDVEEMKQFLQCNNIPNTRFIEVFSNSKWGKEGVFYPNFMQTVLCDYKAYNQWHKEVYKTAKKIISKEHVDVIHFLNPIGFKEPGYLWKLNKPYIWGPISGAHPRPYSLFKSLSHKEKIIAVGRNIIHPLMFRRMPRVISAIKNTNVILSSTPHTKYQLKKFFSIDSDYIPENGVLKVENTKPIHKKASDPLKIIWIGTLCPRKGLQVLLDALLKLTENTSNWELNVIGKGDLENELKITAQSYGIDQNIKWHGFVTREDVQHILNTGHVHVVSSLGEGNPTVLFEAMAKGIPTITVDHCGMEGVICNKCGIKIPLTNYDRITSDFSNSLLHLINNPESLNELSKGTLECAQHFIWEKRLDFFHNQINKAIESFALSNKQ